MKLKTPIKEFGTGALLSNVGKNDVLSVDFIEDLIQTYQFIVIKKWGIELNKLEKWLSSFGELVQNEKRKANTTLILDGSDETEVLRGTGRMPLHCDGALMNENIRLVAIYGVEFNLKSGGRTCISNNQEVWNRLPNHIKNALQENGIEAYPCDKGYYLKNESNWYPFPGVQKRNNLSYINGGLHYHPEETPSYKIRIKGLSPETSYEYYNTMESLFHDEALIYYHNWEQGDLLLMDNVKTMHGREAFDGKRSIAQFQIRD